MPSTSNSPGSRPSRCRLRTPPGRDVRPRPRLPGRPPGLRPARARCPQRPAGRAPPRARHHVDPLGLSSCRTGRRLPRGTAQAHRHPQEHRRPPHPRPDHGRHPRRTDHRTSHRHRRPRRGRDRHPRRRTYQRNPRRRAGRRGGRARPHPRRSGQGHPRRITRPPLVAATVHRTPRRHRRRRPGAAAFRRHPRRPHQLPRRPAVPRPYCDAPARHIDHIHAHRAGGPTTFANGRAVCVRANQVRKCPAGSSNSSTTASATSPTP